LKLASTETNGNVEKEYESCNETKGTKWAALQLGELCALIFLMAGIIL
jgi:hypothetical protein